ncbi:hypothetical protein SELMODRAFT_443084 [Selaginella moellendorffii]|uniref:Uncharacterized protein n=1 Tax=Selaginella moellendorffii TaxID=88036 RepID=D8RY97_SELML|nr:uncharacterized protein LOC9646327 isoform X2 [Selaginella moellendorffii]EFJ22867.1 hypothetical protein SELMODRAFT_443084 [Selaginella moellendorffii]|eukprot:XP_002975962.1 uncharacterized protein LOC9646327 isoform X2 [Selaginella moellendorffii]
MARDKAALDYHKLPRRRLQQLCKKNGIPANKTNLFMADALAALFKAPASRESGKDKDVAPPAAGRTGSAVGDSQSSQCTTEENAISPVKSRDDEKRDDGEHDKHSFCTASDDKGEFDDAHSVAEEPDKVKTSMDARENLDHGDGRCAKLERSPEAIELDDEDHPEKAVAEVDRQDEKDVEVPTFAALAEASHDQAQGGKALEMGAQETPSAARVEIKTTEKGGEVSEVVEARQTLPAVVKASHEQQDEKVPAVEVSRDQNQIAVVTKEKVLVEAVTAVAKQEVVSETKVLSDAAVVAVAKQEVVIETKVPLDEAVGVARQEAEKKHHVYESVPKFAAEEAALEKSEDDRSPAAADIKELSLPTPDAVITSELSESKGVIVEGRVDQTLEVSENQAVAMIVQELEVQTDTPAPTLDLPEESALQMIEELTQATDEELGSEHLKAMLRRAMERSKSRNQYKKGPVFLHKRSTMEKVLERARKKRAECLEQRRFEVGHKSSGDDHDSLSDDDPAPEAPRGGVISSKAARIQQKHREQFKTPIKGKSHRKSEADFVKLTSARRQELLRSKRGMKNIVDS